LFPVSYSDIPEHPTFLKRFTSNIRLFIFFSIFAACSYYGNDLCRLIESFGKETTEKEIYTSDCSSHPELQSIGDELSEDCVIVYLAKVIILEVLESKNNFPSGIHDYYVLLSLNSPPPDFAFTA